MDIVLMDLLLINAEKGWRRNFIIIIEFSQWRSDKEMARSTIEYCFRSQGEARGNNPSFHWCDLPGNVGNVPEPAIVGNEKMGRKLMALASSASNFVARKKGGGPRKN